MDRDYNTHLDILKFITQHVDTVVEYGSGLYSTALFDDFFDPIDQYDNTAMSGYISFEDDKVWAKRMQKKGYNVILVDKMPYYKADLVFIDNGKSIEERVEVIKMHASSPLVVIHDWDIIDYQKAASWDLVITDDKYPKTAICINN